MAILINDTSPRTQYTATASQTVFTIPFEFFSNADLVVYQNTTLKTLTTHYTATGAGVTGGGTLTLVTGATAGDVITIIRDIPVKRVTDFPTSGPFNVDALNSDLDRLTAMVSEREDQVSRVISLAQTDAAVNLYLPTAATRASKVMGFDSTGNVIIAQELGQYRGNWASGTAYVLRDIIKDTSNANIYICVAVHTSTGSQPISSNANSASWALLVDAATASSASSSASASASAASSSASAASSSASSASSSASSATSSASTATTQASNASTSATNAASSASSASTSATAAASSASSAAAYLSSFSSSPTFTGNVTFPSTGIWNSSGDVGIGTATPVAKLDVRGTSYFTGQATFGATIAQFGPVSAASGPNLYFVNTNGGDGAGPSLIFLSNNSAGGQKTAAYINPGLLIATAGAERGLIDFSIYDGANNLNRIITLSVDAGGTSATFGPNVDNYWKFGSSGFNLAQVYTNLIKLGGSTQGILSGYSSTNTQILSFGVTVISGNGNDVGLLNIHSTGNLLFGTNSAEKMRIDSNGQVGVGSVPGTARSFVVGKNITGSTTARGITSIGQIQSDVTATASYFATSSSTSTASYVVSILQHYTAIQGTFNNGSIVTNQYGFYSDSTLIGATNNYGVYSAVSAPVSGVTTAATITALSQTGTTVTVTTSAAHGYTNGQTVTIAATADATALVSGVPCTILAVGTTDFTLIGAASNTVGVSFVATGAGTGTGTVTINSQGSGKTVAGSSGTSFTYTATSATFASITVTGTVTVSTRYNIYAVGTASNYFSGNVGIGNNLPTNKLQVLANTNGLDGIHVSNSSTGASAQARVLIAASGWGGLQILQNQATGTASIYTGDAVPIVFSNNALDRMRIDSSGNVGIGATANASAILDAQSTTKGVRFPNMTTTQKNAISSPAAGLVVMDTTLAKLCVYSGSAWQTITSV